MGNLFRDFIYMDTERLKSIVAQLNQGLIEGTSKTVTDTDGGKINAGIDFLKLLKAGSESSFLFQNQATESHTMHDYLYNLAESSLLEKKLLTYIPEDFNVKDLSIPSLDRSTLSSTSFVLVKGKTIINDFTYMKRFLDNLDNLLKAIIIGEQSANNDFEKLPPKQRNKQVEDRVSQYNLPKDIKMSIQTFLENFYKDRVVIKNIPFVESPNFRFVGTLNQSYLRESIENIIYKYGTAPHEEWFMFAQIASIPTNEQKEVDISFNQNDLENGMQTVFDALRDIEKVGLSITFPEIAVTPIAIYRQ
ncbi:hypothetical protein M5E03_18650 [Bacillus safensis]|nr:hypothetical protein [Bacillus safensis]MBQ4843324.1 hypothetical protein [Bacillus safensis]MBQ4874196.1 hypothetical protein [Bacillus safensis]MBQ4887934.1 hypothetical protein [Bacillus safensis]MBU5209927.1 hypothetical protein [Bacillus safensis]RUK40711.1 hypothetical protein ELP67_18995 [Bacillus safensis]